MSKRKCVICGETIESNEDCVPFKGRYSHISCFNIAMKVTTTDKKEKLSKKTTAKTTKKTTKKNPSELKDNMSEEEFKKKTELFTCIKNISGMDTLSVKVYKLTEDYIKKYGFTYESMRLALEYYYIIKENPVQGECIGILPYIHDDAMSFYDGLITVEEINSNKETKDIEGYYPIKKVKIKPKKTSGRKLIDISKIGGEQC